MWKHFPQELRRKQRHNICMVGWGEKIYYEHDDKRSMLPLIPSDSLKLIYSLALMPPCYKLNRLYFLIALLPVCVGEKRVVLVETNLSGVLGHWWLTVGWNWTAIKKKLCRELCHIARWSKNTCILCCVVLTLNGCERFWQARRISHSPRPHRFPLITLSVLTEHLRSGSLPNLKINYIFVQGNESLKQRIMPVWVVWLNICHKRPCTPWTKWLLFSLFIDVIHWIYN